mmetsp:Transcript_144067/g.268357  ORF Transcript_144067/g.268357 Transcript_144067/m.268357 type:complete len:213 (-) Transcript_144067:72-710(-)
MGNTLTREPTDCCRSCPSCYEAALERIERIEDLDTMKGQGALLQGGLAQTTPVFSTDPGKAPEADAAAEEYALDQQAHDRPYDDEEVQLLIMGSETKAQMDAAAMNREQQAQPAEQEAPVPKEQEAPDDVGSHPSRASSWSMASEEHGRLTDKTPAIGGTNRGASQPLNTGRKRKDGTPVDLFSGFQEVDTLENFEKAHPNTAPAEQSRGSE